MTYTPQPGDIFVSSWGYDQTNVDAYQVRDVTPSGKSIKVQRIGCRLVDDWNVQPIPDLWLNKGPYVRDETGETARDDHGWPIQEAEILTKRIKEYTHNGEAHVSFKVASYANAYLWDREASFHDTLAAGQPGH